MKFLTRIGKMFAFFLLCLTPFSSLLAVLNLPLPQQQPSYDVAVSLGFNCQVAWQMKVNSIRKNAYPFDFVVTSFESLTHFIAYKGEHFLDINKLMFISPGQIEPPPIPYLAATPYVLDLTYGIGLLHDFPLDPNLFCWNYEEVKDKYTRRTQRFFDLLQSNKRILFIRLGLTRDQAIYLDYLIHTLYPNLRYTLLVLNDNEETKTDWGLERVKNHYLRQHVPYFWMGDDAAWQEVFYLYPVRNPPGPSYDDLE